MDKQRFLAKIEDAWTSFKASYEGLTPEQLAAPGVAGEWSIKDIFGHVTTWEEESLKHLPVIATGGQPPRYKDLYGGIDPFNGQMVERKRALPLEEVMRQLEDTHRQLMAYIAAAPDELIATETRFRRRIRWDTYSHYPHHEKIIRDWRARSALAEG